MRSKDPKKMQEIIDFIDQYYLTNHSTPSVRVISENTGLSKSGAQSYLTRMRDEGLIDYNENMIYTDRINSMLSSVNPAAVLGSVPCGQMVMEEENVEEYVDLPISIFGYGKLYLLHAYGDSMTGAGIDPGDLLVVDQLRTPHPGDIVIAYIEGEGTTVKRFWTDPEKKWIVLHPENDRYQDIVVQDCRIQGVVQYIIKKA